VNNRANKAKAWLAITGAAASASFAFPALAFANEKTGVALILPDMVETVPMLIAFIVLVIVLWKFGWPMFEGMLEKREKTIAEALQKSEEARIESERVLAKKRAEEEAASMIEKARTAIEAEKKAAMVDLQSSVADLSVDVATRLVGTDLSDAEHRAIIERYVNEAGSFNGN